MEERRDEPSPLLSLARLTSPPHFCVLRYIEKPTEAEVRPIFWIGALFLGPLLGSLAFQFCESPSVVPSFLSHPSLSSLHFSTKPSSFFLFSRPNQTSSPPSVSSSERKVSSRNSFSTTPSDFDSSVSLRSLLVRRRGDLQGRPLLLSLLPGMKMDRWWLGTGRRRGSRRLRLLRPRIQ